MRNAFTLIELLVVLIVLTLVIAVVVPSGAKLLDQSEAAYARGLEANTFALRRMKAFVAHTTERVRFQNKTYLIKPNAMAVPDDAH